MARLKFWINSFIPATVPGYTQMLTAGPHKGKTAIPLPAIARLWLGNLFKPVNAGYLTDQRSFSDYLISGTTAHAFASSRMHSFIEIETNNRSQIKELHRSSGTTEVDIKTGAQTGFGIANMSRCRFKTNPAITSYDFYRKLEAAAGDPLVGMAADIDYTGELIVTVHGKSSVVVVFEGMIDSFPAYECYASYNGITKTLFTSLPPKGNTVADLLGSASTPISGRVSF